ncbi:MAG: hypothetical protein ABIN91_06800 [Mucilaginibacter sp.]|uniref:hypothetical protein n=1 Tax=Mucilaginibacter sp. TaxID=1882438 RepID=UPI003264FCA7
MNFINKAFSKEYFTYYSSQSVAQIESRLIVICEKPFSIWGLSMSELCGTMNDDGSFNIKHSFRKLIPNRTHNGRLIVDLEDADGCQVNVCLKPPFASVFIVWSCFIIGLILVTNALLQTPFNGYLGTIGVMSMIVIPGLTWFNASESKRNLLDDFTYHFNLSEAEN